VRQQLKRYPTEIAAFESAFGDAEISVSAFIAGAAAHVQVIDIGQRLPDLLAVGGA
jgi:hypothetical protein